MNKTKLNTSLKQLVQISCYQNRWTIIRPLKRHCSHGEKKTISRR